MKRHACLLITPILAPTFYDLYLEQSHLLLLIACYLSLYIGLISYVIYDYIINLTLLKLGLLIVGYLYLNIIFFTSLLFMNEVTLYLAGIKFYDYVFAILNRKDIIVLSMADETVPNTNNLKIKGYNHTRNDKTLQTYEEWPGLIDQREGYRILGNYLNVKVNQVLETRKLDYENMVSYTHSNRIAPLRHRVTLLDLGFTPDHKNEIQRLQFFAEVYKSKYPSFHKSISYGGKQSINETAVYSDNIGKTLIQDITNFKGR